MPVSFNFVFVLCVAAGKFSVMNLWAGDRTERRRFLGISVFRRLQIGRLSSALLNVPFLTLRVMLTASLPPPPPSLFLVKCKAGF